MDGRFNRRNKAASSNSSGVVWTGPNSPCAHKAVPVLSHAPGCYFLIVPLYQEPGTARRAMDTGRKMSLSKLSSRSTSFPGLIFCDV